MPWIPLLIILAVVFLLCFLIDKLFGKIFRGKKQHQSGLSVRLNKRYASIGLIVFVLGIAAMFAEGWLMIVASPAPATPILQVKISRGSSAIFSTAPLTMPTIA